MTVSAPATAWVLGDGMSGVNPRTKKGVDAQRGRSVILLVMLHAHIARGQSMKMKVIISDNCFGRHL